jgi:hypothetical protein
VGFGLILLAVLLDQGYRAMRNRKDAMQ